MGVIKLVLPTEDYKEQIFDYKNEFLANGDSMDGTAGLRNAATFEEWFSALKDNSWEETVRDGLVPASTYLGVRVEDQKLVGMIDIRHRLNEYLLKFGGHIGYSVRKSERRKGYASQMLQLALEKCKEMNIKKVLITCDKDNIASARTIKSQGGILENEFLENKEITQRYWIEL